MTVRVPAIGYETQAWRPTQPELFSRSELRRQTGDYESAVTPRIESWNPTLSTGLSADIADAEQALVEFDVYSATALGAAKDRIVPMSAILLRTESASSSQIENLTASAKQIALAELDETRSVNALTVVGNVRSMEAALELSSNIDEKALLRMHDSLLQNQLGFEEFAGCYRDEPVWIGGDNAGPRGAMFVPPQSEHISSAMNDLFVFADREDMPVLMQAAVAHAQFETIHPFVDGNGRVGRVLVHALLKNKGLVSHTTVPLSAGLLVDLEDYFAALDEFRAGNAEPIIRAFARAARFAAVTGRKLVDDLGSQLETSRAQLAGVRPQANAWKVLPHLVSQPIVNARYLKDHFGFADPGVHNALTVLSERGVLTEKTGLRRNRIWQHSGILAVLDDFAKQIRRSSRVS